MSVRSATASGERVFEASRQRYLLGTIFSSVSPSRRVTFSVLTHQRLAPLAFVLLADTTLPTDLRSHGRRLRGADENHLLKVGRRAERRHPPRRTGGRESLAAPTWWVSHGCDRVRRLSP